MPIDYAPFDGDGRQVVKPTIELPGTCPIPVTNSRARSIVHTFATGGPSWHSSAGGTLWVALHWAQHHKIPYTLQGAVEFGYIMKRMDVS